MDMKCRGATSRDYSPLRGSQGKDVGDVSCSNVSHFHVDAHRTSQLTIVHRVGGQILFGLCFGSKHQLKVFGLELTIVHSAIPVSWCSLVGRKMLKWDVQRFTCVTENCGGVNGIGTQQRGATTQLKSTAI
jgi:hypothetical protein